MLYTYEYTICRTRLKSGGLKSVYIIIRKVRSPYKELAYPKKPYYSL
jgi:hypothetical protein